MTCVVGLEVPGGVWIGADSFLGTDQIRYKYDRPKWFRKGPLVFAWAGDARGAQLVEHALTLPAERTRRRSAGDPVGYLVTVAGRIRQVFREAGANLRVPGSQDTTGTEFLVCYGGRLYLLQQDYSIIRGAAGCAAIGAGEAFALAALRVAREHVPPRDAVARALKEAAELCPSVCEPFYVELFHQSQS